MIKLLHGDCLSLMGDIEPGSIDLILADLPYGTTACKWDTVIPFEPLWAHYKRILKPRGTVVLTASQPFTSMLVMSNREWFRYEWIWEKTVGTGFLDSNRKPLKCHENVCVFYEDQPTYNPQKWHGRSNHSQGRNIGGDRKRSVYNGKYVVTESDVSGMKYPRSVVEFEKNASTKYLHPTQKPVALFEYLIRTYSNEGETVLDNTMGSGTTGVACVNTDRNFVGIEMDAEYFAIAEKRIEEAQADMPLFTNLPLVESYEPLQQGSLFAS